MKYLIFNLVLIGAASVSLGNYTVKSTTPVVQQILEFDITKGCDLEFTTVFHGYECLIPIDVLDIGEIIKVIPKQIEIGSDRTLNFSTNRLDGGIKVTFSHSDIMLYLKKGEESLQEAKKALNSVGSIEVLYQGPEL